MEFRLLRHRFPTAGLLVLAIVSIAGCGTDTNGGRDALLPEDGAVADLAGDAAIGTDIPVPDGAIPIAAGPIDAPDDAWAAAGAAWSRAASAATQMVSVVNALVLRDVDSIGISVKQGLLDDARRSLNVLEDAGQSLVVAADAFGSDGGAVASALTEGGTGDLSLAVRDATVAARLAAIGAACTAEAARVRGILDGVDPATVSNASLDAVVATLRDGAGLAVAAGPVVASAGTVTAAKLPAAPSGAIAGKTCGQVATMTAGVAIVSGAVTADGTASAVPVPGDAIAALAWRGDVLATSTSDRPVAIAAPAPVAPADGLVTLAFPHPSAAVIETSALAPGSACWTADGASDPACALAASGILPFGSYVDREGGGGVVMAYGMSLDVGRRIATGLRSDDVVVALPADPEAVPPTITSFSPPSGPIGTTLSIQGTGFGTDPGRVQVEFSCGQWAVVPPSSVADTQMSATIPARPTLDVSGPWCSYDPGHKVSCGVSLHVAGQPAWGGYFELNALPMCPPSPLYPPDPDIASPGDTIIVYGRGFSPNAESNQARFAGGAVATGISFKQDEYWPDQSWVEFVIPMNAQTGDLVFRNADGVNAWSGPSKMTIVPATVPVLTPGSAEDGLHVPIVTMENGGTSPLVWGHDQSWILGHQNADALRFESYEKTAGHVLVDIETSAGSYSVDAYPLPDGRLVVPVVTDSIGTLGRLDVDASVTLRIRGMETYNRNVRTSAPLVLNVASRVEVGAFRVVPSDLKVLSAWEEALEVAPGTDLAFHLADPADVLVAPGLLPDPLAFQDPVAAAAPWADRNTIRGVRVPVPAPGEYPITNTRTGATLLIRVRAEGHAGYSIWPPLGPGPTDVAANGARFSCGGVRVEVPAGALPLHDGSDGRYTITCNRDQLATLGLAELTTGGFIASVGFDPEPQHLLKTIRLTIPFDPAARAAAPEFGLYDFETGLYASLPATLEDAAVRLEIPAGSYGGGAAKAPGTFLSIPLAGMLPDLPMNRLLGGMVAVSYGVEKGVLRDEERRLQVNYVADPGSTSYVTPDYAGEVLLAMQKTYDTLTTADWPKPDGWLGGWIVATVTDMGPANGTKGSTTKGVFGQPWIKINSNLASGSQLATTTAHEMGHAFQRQLTTVFSLKWIDEAAAGWAAVAALGAEADLSTDLVSGADFPTLSLPTTFGSGYDEDQGYAAAGLAVWMEQVSPGSVLRVYEQLRDSTLAWADARGTLAAATGLTPEKIAEEFGIAWWTQTIDLVSGLSIALTMRDWTRWEGVMLMDSRPAFSSRRFDVSIKGEFAAELAGRDVVVRTSGLDPGRTVRIYRDTLPCGVAGPSMQSMVTVFSVNPSELLGAHDPSTRCYRVLVLNASQEGPATVYVSLVSPHISSLYPSSGKNDGGYTISIGGQGFGGTPGQVQLGGFGLDIVQWTDTSIEATMLDAGTMLGTAPVVVTTAEQAVTNSTTFTFVD